MAARIKHLAICSDNYALQGKFYEALFGMKASSTNYRPEAACSLSDGYLGMNINPRRVGCPAGLDHFGFEVPNMEEVYARVREAYPRVGWVKRPVIRPFAAITMHDPAGNFFDVSESGDANRKDIYADASLEAPTPPRYVQHFMIRALDLTATARFYRDVFDLREQDKDADDPACYLTDGRITVVIAPWNIEDYLDTNIERPALDHLGFAVESVERFQEDLQKLLARNPALTPKALGCGSEGEARLRLFSKCSRGQFQLADLDGVLIDVSEA
jgi:predicted enzyme related to lactoylglutathione lyase